MAKEIKNKIVVITGGTGGIGYEIVDNFLKNEAKTVIILDINETLGNEVAKTFNGKYGNGKVEFLKCDVTKDLDVVYKKVIDSYKQIDVLINAAGILNDKAPKKTIDINVTALIEFSLRFWDHMRKDVTGNGGTIINLASIGGFRVDPFAYTYVASKFAVMGFTKSLGDEYNFKRTGVRVYAICPGFTETSLVSDVPVWDDLCVEDFKAFAGTQVWQKPEVVGKAAAETFAKAESGSAWLIEGSRPIAEVILSSSTR